MTIDRMVWSMAGRDLEWVGTSQNWLAAACTGSRPS
jgi:hypothetical protein